MALTCNIDSRGKKLRLINGIVTLVLGVILLFAWAMRTGNLAAWAVVVCVMLAGGFMVFEGWAGWCVVRAMGFKTRI